MSDASVTRTIWDVRIGEHLLLEGGRISIDILETSGKHARLLVIAPREVKITREAGECVVPCVTT